MTGAPRLAARIQQTLSRPPQLMSSFTPGDPQSGFYNDLRVKALEHGTPEGALAAARSMTASGRLAYPVSIVQLGLGAWQLSLDDRRWLAAVEHTVDWILAELDDRGRLACRFAMPHTFRLDPPWYSAMAQGEAASLLVRAATALERPRYLDGAARAIDSLCRSDSGLVSETPEGPVLQEYPTAPPAHVLNGWIWGLWGLYDVGVEPALGGSEPQRLAAAQARSAFDVGTRTLAARLPLYEVGLGWSRYDLFPRRIPNVASPFYHRLHIEQLRAMTLIAPGIPAFEQFADRWAASLSNPAARTHAVVLKSLFRVVEPRKRVH
jgi:heparosan-N-sulfate-glucuronate 5-epimerase